MRTDYTNTEPEMLDEIKAIEERPLPPELTRQKICKSCAYYDLCFI